MKRTSFARVGFLNTERALYWQRLARFTKIRFGKKRTFAFFYEAQKFFTQPLPEIKAEIMAAEWALSRVQETFQ